MRTGGPPVLRPEEKAELEQLLADGAVRWWTPSGHEYTTAPPVNAPKITKPPPDPDDDPPPF